MRGEGEIRGPEQKHLPVRRVLEKRSAAEVSPANCSPSICVCTTRLVESNIEVQGEGGSYCV